MPDRFHCQEEKQATQPYGETKRAGRTDTFRDRDIQPDTNR